MNTRTNHGAIVPIGRVEQLKPFTLPTPPPGMKWHREDGWTAEMLPPGKRPFFLGETSVKSNHDNPTDQVGGGKWAWGTLAKGEIATVDCKHLRTARPLLFIHSGHEWTWHRAGDPMPCGGNRYVILLGDSPSHEESEAQQGSYWLWQSPILNCIGWRYADAEKKPKVPLGPEDVPPFSAIRRKPEQDHGQQWHWRCMSYVHGIGIQCGNRGYKWEELQKDYEINRSIPLTGKWNPEAWEPCEK